MTPAVLEVRHLRVRLDLPQGPAWPVRDVSLQVRRGQALALAGESGSGKSMTGMAIMRLIDPPGSIESGSVQLEGREIAHVPEPEMRKLRGARIAMIFQDPMSALNPVLRIETQIRHALQAHHANTRAAHRERAAAALQRAGLPDPQRLLRRYPHQLSGGMRQRVAIAIALLHEPPVIIADEATTALDVTTQAAILEEMRRLTAGGTGLVWITHDLAVASALADELAVMYAGRIVESGPTSVVLGHPLHPYTKALLDSAPSRNERGTRLRQLPGAPPSLLHVPAGCPFRPRCPRARVDCVNDPAETNPAPGRRLRCFHPEPG